MEKTRQIEQVLTSQPTIEGAGVHLQRVFGFYEVPQFDPFLLMDDFRSDDPSLFLAGFPWHPHRGIETITYMLAGTVEHGDSLGNSGVIGPGDVQWMTAGSGIIHQEMPKPDSTGHMGGFQLWANLPAASKMMAPRYQEIKSTGIPVITQPGGATIRIIAGQVGEVSGPVQDIVSEPAYLDVSLPAGAEFIQPTPAGHTVLAYVIEGSVSMDPNVSPVKKGQLAHFSDGLQVSSVSSSGDARFLLLSGRPLREPVAWRGPIVMNTQAELRLAFEEYRLGTFIKPGK